MSMENLYSILSFIVLVYLGVVAFTFFSQSRMLYLPDYPSRQITFTPDQYGLSYESVDIETEDRIKIHGWFLPVENARATLLFFHGNAGNLSHRKESLLIFHRLRLSVLIIDYRGYGLSDGTPSEEGTYRDADAAWRFLTEQKGVPARDIIIFGRSLGAAVAAYLASTQNAQALVMESPFISIPELASELYPWLPARWLSRFSYDNAVYLKRIEMPLLIIHSKQDEITPFSHGRALYELAHEPKFFFAMEGTHNTGILENLDSYLQTWGDFIEQSQISP